LSGDNPQNTQNGAGIYGESNRRPARIEKKPRGIHKDRLKRVGKIRNWKTLTPPPDEGYNK
jgi:hypothetical protein